MSTAVAPQGILDTSVVILLESIDPVALPEEPVITAVTLAELSVGPLVAADERERSIRQARLQEAESAFEPIPFDADAARAFGRVAESLRRAGRKAQARTFDAMIAAIALAYDLPVFTANPEDFSGIEGIDVRAIPNRGEPVPPPAAEASGDGG